MGLRPHGTLAPWDIGPMGLLPNEILTHGTLAHFGSFWPMLVSYFTFWLLLAPVGPCWPLFALFALLAPFAPFCAFFGPIWPRPC